MNKAKAKSGKNIPGKKQAGERWMLRLYVAGETPKSLTALANLKQLCEQHLRGLYSIELVDLLKNPSLARGDQILAVPTLVRRLPPPLKKIIGDLSDRHRVLVGLNIVPADRKKPARGKAAI